MEGRVACHLSQVKSEDGTVLPDRVKATQGVF